MATFARLDENNVVIDVIKVSNEDCAGGNFPSSESVGQEFIKSIGLEGNWIQTSVSAEFRGKHAGIGDKYSPTLDAFVPDYGSTKPYPSWIQRDGEVGWFPPVRIPDVEGWWQWDEEAGEWTR
jgi:hypothetical protein